MNTYICNDLISTYLAAVTVLQLRGIETLNMIWNIQTMGMYTTKWQVCILACTLQNDRCVPQHVHGKMTGMYLGMYTTKWQVCNSACTRQNDRYVTRHVHVKMTGMYLGMYTTKWQVCTSACTRQNDRYVPLHVHVKMAGMYR